MFILGEIYYFCVFSENKTYFLFFLFFISDINSYFYDEKRNFLGQNFCRNRTSLI
jgi:hypothetical protein